MTVSNSSAKSAPLEDHFISTKGGKLLFLSGHTRIRQETKSALCDIYVFDCGVCPLLSDNIRHFEGDSEKLQIKHSYVMHINLSYRLHTVGESKSIAVHMWVMWVMWVRLLNLLLTSSFFGGFNTGLNIFSQSASPFRHKYTALALMRRDSGLPYA